MRRTTGLDAGAGRRRWPWALGATAAGAAAGAVVAYALRRAGGDDAPTVQDPEDVRAVVDRPGDEAP